MKKFIIIILVSTFLISCSGGKSYAPVRSIATKSTNTKAVVTNADKQTSSKYNRLKASTLKPRSGKYVVRKSDTLYSIAFKFGLDFKQLSQFNQIKMPYTIFPGQVLNLKAKKIINKKAKNKNLSETKKSNKQVNQHKNKIVNKESKFDQQKKITSWMWPVNNSAQKKISSWKKDKQGINISGQFSEPVRAAAAGRVVYSGSGLVGYGKLIIIKHSRSYLSAYANNNKLMVKEDDLVKVGQKIATMGKNDTGLIELHFEIRHEGRPVNPMKYLPKSN